MNTKKWTWYITLSYSFLHAQQMPLSDILNPLRSYHLVHRHDHPGGSLNSELYAIAEDRFARNLPEPDIQTHDRLKELILCVIDHAHLKNQRLPHKNTAIKTEYEVADIAINPEGTKAAFAGIGFLNEYDFRKGSVADADYSCHECHSRSDERALAYHPHEPLIAGLSLSKDRVHMVDTAQKKITACFNYQEDGLTYHPASMHFNQAGTKILYGKSLKFIEKTFDKFYRIHLKDRTRKTFSFEKPFNFFMEDAYSGEYMRLNNDPEYFVKPLVANNCYFQAIRCADQHKMVFRIRTLEDKVTKEIETPFDCQDFCKNYKDVDLDAQQEHVAIHFKDKIVIYNITLNSIVQTFDKSCSKVKISPQGDFITSCKGKDFSIDFIDHDYTTPLRNYFNQQLFSATSIRQQLLALMLISHKKDNKLVNLRNLHFAGKPLDKKEVKETLNSFPAPVQHCLRKIFFDRNAVPES